MAKMESTFNEINSIIIVIRSNALHRRQFRAMLSESTFDSLEVAITPTYDIGCRADEATSRVLNLNAPSPIVQLLKVSPPVPIFVLVRLLSEMEIAPAEIPMNLCLRSNHCARNLIVASKTSRRNPEEGLRIPCVWLSHQIW